MFGRIALASIAVLAIMLPVRAQQASYAMFDFEDTGDGIELVVAIQPERAVQIIGGEVGYEDMLQTVRDGAELLAAYAESHVELSQGKDACAWSARPDAVPETLLDAQAEGITLRGLVRCPRPQDAFSLSTDLFVESPGHQNIVRYRDGDAFYAFATLDYEAQRTTVDLREVFETTIRQTEDVVRHARRVNEAIGAVIVVSVIGIAFWLRRKASKM
jgi:hypothetical protein